ncbi:unnamed protein product [Prorocentrum cordatum]|uniref:CASTOR/POLLUX/SYM8 ion channel conserved domain-containing protein n=1 Tax=Prorocentrum cordatum TaxID=2364126 RepID=A0ABN9RYM7_9DINO|nr:unnamed protein product [Polarella glacialis]
MSAAHRAVALALVFETSARAQPAERAWSADGPGPAPSPWVPRGPNGAWRRSVSRLERELGALRGAPEAPLAAGTPEALGPRRAHEEALWAEALLGGGGPPPSAPGLSAAAGGLRPAWGAPRARAVALPHAGGVRQAAGLLGVGARQSPPPPPLGAVPLEAEAIQEMDRDDALIVVFAVIVTLFLAFCVYQAARSYVNYRRFKSEAADCTKEQKRGARMVTTSMWDYNRYHLSYWFVTFPGAKAVVIFGIFVFLVLLGSILYYTIEGERISVSLHKVIAWLVSPDSGVAEKSKEGSTMGVFLSISGLLLFALMLSMIQDAFTSFVDEIHQGHSNLVTTNHTVVLAFDYANTQTIPLVQQLCYAFEHQPYGETIAVLTSNPKVEAEAHIRSSVDLRNSRLVVRNGTPDNKDALQSVAVQFARRVVITVNGTLSREQRDAYTMQALIALKSHDWPARGDILLLTSLPRHEATFQRVGGTNTHILSLDHVVANILVLCSEYDGICNVIDMMVGFDGSEFYIADVPEFLVGKTFGEASFYYPQGLVVGCGFDAYGHPRLCNDPKQEMALGDKLIIVAEDAGSLQAQQQRCVSLEDASHPLAQQCMTRRESVDHGTHNPFSMSAHLFDNASSGNKVTILILGWSSMVGLMLVKLDRVVPSGSKVISFHYTPVDDRKQRINYAQVRYETNLEHLEVECIQGDLCSKKGFDDMPTKFGSSFWNEVGRIFIVCEHSPAEAWQDDASTMATAVMLRSSLTEHIPDRSEHPPIIVELHSPQSRKMAINQGFENYVMTSSIPSQVMATVARQPLLKNVLRNAFSNRGHPVQVRGLNDYVQVPDHQLKLTFYQLQSIISNSDDILIGWSKPRRSASKNTGGFTDEDAEREDSWDFNPADKKGYRSWDVAKDKMIVITGHPNIHGSHSEHH